MQNNTLKVGIVYSPEGYYKSGDSIGGISHDLLTRLSRDENIKFEFIPIHNIEESLIGLTNGKFDIIAALPSNPELSSNFLLSEPIGFQRLILIQNSNMQKCQSWIDLAGEIINCESDLHLSYPLKKINHALSDTITIIEHPELSGKNIYERVDNGLYQYAIIHDTYCNEYLSNYPNVESVPRLSFTRTIHLIVSPNDSVLLKRINLLISKHALTVTLQ